jgi:hypothetical protein
VAPPREPARVGVPKRGPQQEESGPRSSDRFRGARRPLTWRILGVAYADGSGGVAIVETDSAATIAKATAPFTPWLRFSTTPILPVEEASAIAGEAAAARASFSG